MNKIKHFYWQLSNPQSLHNEMLHEHIEPENKMTQSLSALYVYIWHTGFNKKTWQCHFPVHTSKFQKHQNKSFKKRKKCLLYADALLRHKTGN